MQTGELPDALQALDEHLAQHPDDTDVRRMHAEVAARMNDEAHLRAALADYKLLGEPLAPDDALRCSGVYERLKDHAGALKTISAARQAQPEHERLIERHIHLLQAQGEYRAALDILASLSADKRAAWRWQQWSGDLAAQIGDYAQAVTAYSAALDALPQIGTTVDERWALSLRARLLLARGEAYRQLGQAASAEADYLAADVLLPGDPAVPFNRGLLAASRGEIETARQLIETALKGASPLVLENFRAVLQTYPQLAGIIK